MADRSITSADAIVMLLIATLFPSPRRLAGFSADDIYSADPIESGEVSMGVDGRLSAGFRFVPVKQTFSLQADSVSNDVFERWWNQEQLAKTKYRASANVTLPSLGKTWTCTRGVLTTVGPLPNAATTLRPRAWGITWERVVPANNS